MTIKQCQFLLLEKAKTYLSSDEIKQLTRCIDFGRKAHAGQKRKSKAPYYTHPLTVALILANLEQDVFTLCGALLHDTLEDCDVCETMISDAFGKTILKLVDGVTKLTAVSFHSTEEEQSQNYRKMLLAMTKDARVMIIKLADRLHNMQTIKWLPDAAQLRMARETMDVFAPLAHRLGIASLQWQLEDLAFTILYPDDFQAIKSFIATKRSQRDHHLQLAVHQIEGILKKHRLQATVKGRAKHFFSIYKKCKKKGLSYEELFDTLGVRIVCRSVGKCYEVLGHLHTAFKPVSARFKDYIAVPKPNRYQSLHTAIIGPLGTSIECQIRTSQMHMVAEFGIASHLLYKEGKFSKRIKQDFNLIDQLESIESEHKNPDDFLSELKDELIHDHIFVFTPKGDVKTISEDSTVLDFAFRIHTDLGRKCTGAKINDRLVPLHYILQNGDQIELLSSKNQHPKSDWLKFVTTRHAKSKIKQWLKHQNRDSMMAKGKTEFSQWLSLKGFLLSTWLTDEMVATLLKKMSIHSMDLIYLSISQGEVSCLSLTKGLIEEPKVQAKLPDPSLSLTKHKQNSIHIFGQASYLTTLSKCCSPVFGDPIKGVITKQRGIKIHRDDCKHFIRLIMDRPELIVDANWAEVDKNNYEASLVITAFDSMGLLQQITTLVAACHINMIQIKSHIYDHGNKMQAFIRVLVPHRDHLANLMKQLRTLPDVIGIKRK